VKDCLSESLLVLGETCPSVRDVILSLLVRVLVGFTSLLKGKSLLYFEISSRKSMGSKIPRFPIFDLFLQISTSYKHFCCKCNQK